MVGIILYSVCFFSFGSDDEEKIKSSPDPTAMPSHLVQEDTTHPTPTPTLNEHIADWKSLKE